MNRHQTDTEGVETQHLLAFVKGSAGLKRVDSFTAVLGHVLTCSRKRETKPHLSLPSFVVTSGEVSLALFFFLHRPPNIFAFWSRDDGDPKFCSAQNGVVFIDPAFFSTPFVMANFDHQDQAGTERPRQSFQQLPQRSLASTNWRMKDDSPRADPQPRQNRQNQYQGQNRSYDSPGRSQNSQLREAPGTRLYVGNLLYSATRNDVEQFFTANGFNVSGISMSVDPATGRNPSYCFVDFETPEDATKAMADLNGVELLGRGVRINVGVARQGNSATPQGKSGYGNQGGTSRGWGQGRSIGTGSY